MELHITLGPRREHSGRIYQQLLDAILDGRLREGDRLPATRTLATNLAISRTTVALAYERLVAEGYLAGRIGAGTYVRDAGRPAGGGRAARATGAGGAEPDHAAGPRPRAIWDTLPAYDTTVEPGVRYAFAIGLPDISLFPFETWRRLVARELRTARLGTGDYTEPAGLPELRAAIARHYGVSRGLRASPEDVVVTHGAQQAIDLVGRVLIDPGTTVAVEDPGYPPARHAFASMGARVVGVPVDASGLVVDALPSAARIVYVTPSHQFPLGVAMSPARRAALLTWARRRGAVIIEDDYDSEFRFREARERNTQHSREARERNTQHSREARERNSQRRREGSESERPLQPIHSVDRSGSVIYVGTFSKTMFPALRLGFLIAPPSLRSALQSAKQLADWHTDTVSQAALARFIDEGLLARHIRRAARHYAKRRAMVLSWLRTQEHRLEVMPASAGLHLTALVAGDEPVDVPAAVQSAAGAGVIIRSIASFYGDRVLREGIMLGYGGIPTDRIPAGLRHLEAALAGPRDDWTGSAGNPVTRRGGRAGESSA